MSELRYLFLVLILLLQSLPRASVAESVTLHKIAGYEMGYGTFTFDQKLDHKIVFPVANITAGLAYKRFSYILNVSGSLSDADISEEEQVGHGSRRDIDLTVGYQLNKMYSVFAGYKDGLTKLTLINRIATVPGGGNERYQQQGFYTGVNINWAFKNAGKLGFSLAYAQLDATNVFVQDEPYDPLDAFEFDDVSGNNKGVSSGFSYSLSWSMPLKGHLLFRSRLKVNAYEQDLSGQYYAGAAEGYKDYEFNNVGENSTMLLIGITGVF